MCATNEYVFPPNPETVYCLGEEYVFPSFAVALPAPLLISQILHHFIVPLLHNKHDHPEGEDYHVQHQQVPKQLHAENKSKVFAEQCVKGVTGLFESLILIQRLTIGAMNEKCVAPVDRAARMDPPISVSSDRKPLMQASCNAIMGTQGMAKARNAVCTEVD